MSEIPAISKGSRGEWATDTIPSIPLDGKGMGGAFLSHRF